MKKWLDIDVLTAAQNRLDEIFDEFPQIYVSFSGGKDSTVLLHLAAEAARQRGRKIGVLFIDWEAQYRLTIEHVERMLDLYEDVLEVHWVALPLLTTNACSMMEPEWTCWQKGKQWVRPMPDRAISDTGYFNFFTDPMTFEDFVPAFAHWFAAGERCACLVGIRSDESLNRYRTIAKGARNSKRMWGGRPWTTGMGHGVFNAYPLYDWSDEDVWIYHGKTGLPYNELYDRMHKAGLTIHQMRICEPYGDEQRKGLWLFHLVEPETWGRVVARVNGANSAALYAAESGNILGNLKISKPEHLSWEEFAMMLLDTMPAKTADHYKNKIAVWMKWYHDRGKEIADELEGDTGSKDMGSWRRVCKMLLKNDYWAKTLCFSPTKADAYDQYRKLMKRRRKNWGIFDAADTNEG